MQQLDNSRYFFELKKDELARALMNRVTEFQEFAITSGQYQNWRKNQRFYENNFYGNTSGGDIIDAGAVGELKATSFNHFRNVIRHTLNQLTGIVPAFDVSANNTDVASRRAAAIGRDIIHYYFKIKRATNFAKKTAEKALVHGAGFYTCEWNPVIGREIATDGENVIREGDFEFGSRSVFNCFFDFTLEDYSEWDWFIFRKKVNKFNLAKMFPKRKDDILALSNFNDDDSYYQSLTYQENHQYDSPFIYVYTGYHKSCPALEKGKHVIFVGNGESAFHLYDGPNPYGDHLPLFVLTPADYIDSCLGFTESNVIRGPQEVINSIVSSMVTNATAAGVNNIWTPEGSNLNLDEVVDGMNLITTASDKKPEVISFYKDIPGLKDLMSIAITTIETLSGQNAAVRGNVQETPNLKSGVAIATVINMAQQYSQALERNYIEMFEDVATFMLKTLQKVAKTERLIDISGKMNKTSVQSFTRDDLRGISRVLIDQTNPITKQPAGKIEIAMELLKIGKITPEKFFDVVNTGNLDNATEADERLLDFIASVKEKLLEGEQIPPIPGINHQVYIKEIQSLLFDTELVTKQENAGIMENIVNTINSQMELLRQGDEISNLIYGGQSPTPPAINRNEMNLPGPLQGLPEMDQNPNQPPPIEQPMELPPGLQ